MIFDNFNMTLYGPMFTRCTICVIPAFSLLKFIDTFGAWSIEQQLKISAAGEGLKVSKGNIWLLSFDISDDYFLCQQKICSFIQTQRHISSGMQKKIQYHQRMPYDRRPRVNLQLFWIPFSPFMWSTMCILTVMFIMIIMMSPNPQTRRSLCLWQHAKRH